MTFSDINLNIEKHLDLLMYYKQYGNTKQKTMCQLFTISVTSVRSNSNFFRPLHKLKLIGQCCITLIIINDAKTHRNNTTTE